MFLRILNKHSPIKSKLFRANHALYISKPLRKAIMKRSYLENRTDHSLRSFKIQNAIDGDSTKKRETLF